MGWGISGYMIFKAGPACLVLISGEGKTEIPDFRGIHRPQTYIQGQIKAPNLALPGQGRKRGGAYTHAAPARWAPLKMFMKFFRHYGNLENN